VKTSPKKKKEGSAVLAGTITGRGEGRAGGARGKKKKMFLEATGKLLLKGERAFLLKRKSQHSGEQKKTCWEGGSCLREEGGGYRGGKGGGG